MRVLEVGPGMGFFTIAMARMVAPAGRVVAVDVQRGMLDRLRIRATRAKLSDIIELRWCSSSSLAVADLLASIDFILLFAVVHETADHQSLFAELATVARPGCNVLVAEPKGHVSEHAFAASIAVADAHGFSVVDRPVVPGSHAALLRKQIS